jgi:hypothetical protein
MPDYIVVVSFSATVQADTALSKTPVEILVYP